MQAIKVNALTYVYSKRSPFEKVALDEVSFEINEGEFVAVTGETGSGKSTLIQHLNGLIRPQAGAVEVLGLDASDKKNLKKLRFQVGMVFQYPEYQLFEDTVARDIAFGPKNMKLDADEIDRRIKRAMELVGLPYSEFSERSPFELSGGEKRRAAIAGVIAMEPKILVLDEPFAGLDPEGVNEITALISKLKAEVSPTIVLVSHSMDAVAELADRMLVLSNGKLVADGSPKAVFGDRKLISEVGLDLPFAAKICDMVSEKGVQMPTDVIRFDDLIDVLARLKREKNSGASAPDCGGTADDNTDSCAAETQNLIDVNGAQNGDGNGVDACDNKNGLDGGGNV